MIDETGGGASRSTEPAMGSSAATDVSLREYIVVLIDALRREVVATSTSDEEARKLQATEYERRLTDLNNEASRLQAAVAQNVSADTWHAFETQYRTDRRTDDERMKKIENFQARLAGALVLATALTATIVYLLTKLA